MANLLNNPNTKKVIPRTKSPDPTESVKFDEISKTPVASQRVHPNTQVTYDSTVRMNNHLKNFVKAMVILGMSSSQQSAMETLEETYRESLSDPERKTLAAQIETLEIADAVKSNK